MQRVPLQHARGARAESPGVRRGGALRAAGVAPGRGGGAGDGADGAEDCRHELHRARRDRRGGRAGTFHHVIVQSNTSSSHPGSTVHVTKLTLPGSDNPSRALVKKQLMTAKRVHVANHVTNLTPVSDNPTRRRRGRSSWRARSKRGC
jgi:hypothetical protein